VAAPTPAPAPLAAAPAASQSTAAAGPAGAPPSLSLAVQFDTNSAQVRPESGRVLGNLVAAMQSPDLKGARFTIEGHTDARGTPAANQQLSQQRADEVRLYLIALGVHPARLRAVGKGSSDPANPLDPAAPENRRVRVVTLE
jgi:outer membrane protein OmpA-like peptidoglycan-associated protein